MEQKSVLFVEYTAQGELGKRLRELMTRLTPHLGFNIKVVERTGSALKHSFPQSSLWEGEHCGRGECTTCNQGAEFKTNCSKKSAVYENTCLLCNPAAGKKEELVELKTETPSLYVGETSRTVKERSGEHWAAYRGSAKAKASSHIYKHQELNQSSRQEAN